MIERSRLPLLLAVVAVLGGGVGLLALWSTGEPQPASERRAAAPGRVAAAPATAPEDAAPPDLRPPGVPVAVPPPTRVGEVASWPLSVDLELVWADPDPPASAPRLRPWGTGRTARLEGRFADAAGRGIRAQVSIVAGSNEGRSVTSTDEGLFAMDGLYPGLALVEVRAPGIPGSRREVLLGRDRTSLMNIGYGRLTSVTGKVVDRAGEGIGEARVVFDGQVGWTDETGTFHFPGVASGPSLVEVSKEGYAAYREKMNLVAGTVVTGDRIRFVLQEESVLVLTAKTGPGGAAPVEVHLLPSRATSQRGFPWHTVNPVEVRPGTQVRVGGLPATPIYVRAFQRGAATKPRLVSLRRGEDLSLVLEFDAGARVTGRVTREGHPVAGASVRLEAPDRTRATLAYFRMPSTVLSNEVVATLPPAYQEARTAADGTFAFTAWPDASELYYLEARGPSGDTGASAVAGAGTGSLELALEPLDGGPGRLVLATPDRALDLRVAVAVTGREARDPLLVAAGEDIEIDGLRPGTWRVRARWEKGELLDEHRVRVADEAVVELALPTELSGVE